MTKQGLVLAETFGVDKTKATEGVWVELGNGAAIKVARAKNPKVNAFLQKELAPYRQQIQIGTLDPAILEDITYKAVAKHILLDWRGILSTERKEIPYSVETAEQFLRDMPDFAELVDQHSGNIANFRDSVIEDTSGKSSPPSSGGTNSVIPTSNSSEPSSEQASE